MSAHVLLNFSMSWGKVIKCEACRAFYDFFATSLINSNHVCNIVMDVITFPVNL